MVVVLWRLGNAMCVNLRCFIFCITLFSFALTNHTALAKVGDTYYCEKTGGRLLFNDGKSFDYFALQKNEGTPIAFLVEHLETSLRVKGAEYSTDFEIVNDNFGTDVRSISADKQSHLVIWVKNLDSYSFTLTYSSPYDLRAEVGFCKKFS